MYLVSNSDLLFSHGTINWLPNFTFVSTDCMYSQKWTFSSCDFQLQPMNKLQLDRVEVNQHAKCLRQRSSLSKVIVKSRRHTHTRPSTLPGPLKWLVTILNLCLLITHNCFYGPFSGTTWVSHCQKKSSGLYGARGDIRGRHTDNPAGCHSIRTNPWPTFPPFLRRMPFLSQPSQFILA